MKNEYIQGDLVTNKYYTKVLIVIKTVKNMVYTRNRDAFSETYLSHKDDVVPMLLTPEILEKNGWNEERYGLVYYKKVSETLYFRLIGKSYGWTLRCGNQNLIEKLEFVHQLQHILFGIGLNSEMEV